MKCLNCGAFTLLAFCEICEFELAELSPTKRNIRAKNGEKFPVYAFYKYSEIRHLILSKHKFYGYFVYNFLAKLSFAKFKDFFSPQTELCAIALDDRVENLLYSHTAILLKHLKSPLIKPLFAALWAQNKIKYSGKSEAFRQNNKRKFKLLKKPSVPVILVDDLITTGTSLKKL